VRFSNLLRSENSAAVEPSPQASQTSAFRSAPQFKHRVMFISAPDVN
jgi:hypothetical protein